jgi:membrane protein implicated in regulation of membrane protease activity
MSTATLLAIGGATIAVLELFVLDFTLLGFAVGILVAAGAFGAGASGVIAGSLGLLTSIAALGFARPLLRRCFRPAAARMRGTDMLLGATGSSVTEVGERGQVELLGEVWAARAFDGVLIPAGSSVEVIAMEGTTAAVLPANHYLHQHSRENSSTQGNGE